MGLNSKQEIFHYKIHSHKLKQGDKFFFDSSKNKIYTVSKKIGNNICVKSTEGKNLFFSKIMYPFVNIVNKVVKHKHKQTRSVE